MWGINQTGLYVSYDTVGTWKKIYGVDYFIGSWSFDFYDSLFGVLTTSYSQAYLTTDGGSSWMAFSKPIGNHPTDCKILGTYVDGSQRILEIGSNGKALIIYIYPNGDIDFSYQIISFTGKKLNKIEIFVEDDFPHVWVAGDGFTILYRQFEKIFTDVDEYKYKPLNFSLSQNYPNPFNPSTNIRFGIANSGFVSLKVFDIIGREVATLVTEEKSPGDYEIEFNASGLTSGLYIYKLQTENYSLTKKMIYLK